MATKSLPQIDGNPYDFVSFPASNCKFYRGQRILNITVEGVTAEYLTPEALEFLEYVEELIAQKANRGKQMGRIFISAGHDLRDPGATALGTTESLEMRKTRDLIVQELKKLGIEYLSVPDTLSLSQTIRWINANSLPGDVALEIHGNAFNGNVRGAEIFYIATNFQRRQDAQLMLDSLLDAVPELSSRGAKADTSSQYRSGLGFCRQVAVASLLMELCFIDNRQDLDLLQRKRDQFAKGIAKGLIEWSGQAPKYPEYPVINIRIKDSDYLEKGILVNSNSFIPADLAELLGFKITDKEEIRQISYGGIVYFKAVDLQQFNVAVSWENSTRTVILNTITHTEVEALDQIMRDGIATETELKTLLDEINPEALQQFSDLPKLYIEEADIENVNHDVAFCQMCLETNYLRFGGRVKPEQNNFCGLGAIDGNANGASFSDRRTGVKAHIEHLKAYASTDLIVQQPIVDPRFKYVPRGVAPSVYDLARRWNPDPEYGEKIMMLIKRLHGVF